MICPMTWTSMCTGLVSNLLTDLNSAGWTFDELFPLGRTGRVGNLGKATSFIDPEGDGDVMPKLVDMLTKVLKSGDQNMNF